MRDRQMAIATVTVAVLYLAAAHSMAEDAFGVSPAASPSAPPDKIPPSVTILNSHDVEGILGRQVRSTANENMGRVVDVMVDRSGQVRAAIIDFGGFLGVGSRKIAVEWHTLRFPPPARTSAEITIGLTRDQVKARAGI